MRAFVMCDGEEAQIRVFQEPEIKQLMDENLIDFGKTPVLRNHLMFLSFSKLLKAPLNMSTRKTTRIPVLSVI